MNFSDLPVEHDGSDLKRKREMEQFVYLYNNKHKLLDKMRFRPSSLDKSQARAFDTATFGPPRDESLFNKEKLKTIASKIHDESTVLANQSKAFEFVKSRKELIKRDHTIPRPNNEEDGQRPTSFYEVKLPHFPNLNFVTNLETAFENNFFDIKSENPAQMYQGNILSKETQNYQTDTLPWVSVVNNFLREDESSDKQEIPHEIHTIQNENFGKVGSMEVILPKFATTYRSRTDNYQLRQSKIDVEKTGIDESQPQHWTSSGSLPTKPYFIVPTEEMYTTLKTPKQIMLGSPILSRKRRSLDLISKTHSRKSGKSS